MARAPVGTGQGHLPFRAEDMSKGMLRRAPILILPHGPEGPQDALLVWVFSGEISACPSHSHCS